MYQRAEHFWATNYVKILQQGKTYFVWLPLAKSSFFSFLNCIDVKARVLPTEIHAKQILLALVFEQVTFFRPENRTLIQTEAGYFGRSNKGKLTLITAGLLQRKLVK